MRLFLLLLISFNAYAVLPVVDTTVLPPKAVTTKQSLVYDAPGPDAGPGYTYPVNNGQAKIRINAGLNFTDVAYTDLIVSPGKNSAHIHCFFGNEKGSIKTSTMTDLMTAGSSADGGFENRSSYWIPCLIDTRTNTVVPFKVKPLIYYNGPLTDQWFPDGMELLSGNSTNTDADNWYLREKKIMWECEGVASRLIPLICHQNEFLRFKVFMPNCSDGRLSSPDHYSHLTFATYDINGVKLLNKDMLPNQCPKTHPIRLPDLAFLLTWKMTDDAMINYIRLSSDPIDQPAGITAHGDAKELHGSAYKENILNYCLKGRMDCGGSNIGPINGVFKVLGEVK